MLALFTPNHGNMRRRVTKNRKTTDGHGRARQAAHSECFGRVLQRLNEKRSIQEHLAKGAKDPRIRKRYQENAAASEDMRLLKEILSRL
jgi:hypothetical protein